MAPSTSHQALTQMAGIRRTLRHRREAAGISQGALADGLRVSRETVNRREKAGVLDINLVDLLAWVVRLGGEVTVTFNVTPMDAPRSVEWGRVAYPDYALDGEVLPIAERRHDDKLGMDLVVLVSEGARIALPAANVLPADPPAGS